MTAADSGIFDPNGCESVRRLGGHVVTASPEPDGGWLHRCDDCGLTWFEDAPIEKSARGEIQP